MQFLCNTTFHIKRLKERKEQIWLKVLYQNKTGRAGAGKEEWRLSAEAKFDVLAKTVLPLLIRCHIQDMARFIFNSQPSPKGL